MHNYDLSPLFRQLIGFDKLARSIQNDLHDVNYPSYNIEKEDDNHYCITLALAGFNRNELMIELDGQHLIVKGKPELAEKKTHYLHQGLICKKFSLSFTLAEHMVVNKADFVNGLLNIYLERHVPESLQPRRIIIGTVNQQSKLQDNTSNTKQNNN